jgi:hypothetical protein
MADLADELRSVLASESIRLMAITDDAASVRRSAGKWSPKEVIGHLIDSATTNHGRFVRAQLGDDMFFEGYDQDAWVRVQSYASRPWLELVSVWRSVNAHIAATVEHMSHDAMTRPRSRHNLDQIAWRTLPRNEPATLEYFVRDYIGHMRHHLAQIP